jgi:uncharacterized protein
MLISVRVTSNAKEPLVTKTGETSLEVRVDEKAVGGRANKRLLEILSQHFNIPKSSITIARGTRSRDKIVEIMVETPSNLSSHGLSR